jgi:hypothetical protein
VSKEDIINASIIKLAKIIGPEILTLPLFIDDKNKAPAWTNGSGIYISRRVYDLEPENVNVFIMHEVMHYVVRDPEIYGIYPNGVVNIAEDYKINYLIKRQFGYDVRKTKIIN